MIRIDRRALLAAWAALPLMGCAVAGDGGPADPLPSWNGGPAKTAIVEFVEAVTTEGGVNYVPPDARIATFDNDGTLWAEQPIYFQFAFALDRIKALAPQHPEWQDTQPFKAVLEGDPQALAASGEKGLLEIIAATHAGMTTDEFSATVADWLATARHPRFDRPYTELVYQPMLELLAYLRESGFKTFIVSGGGVEFMRVFAERVRYSARAGGRLVGRCEARDGAGRQARPHERGQGRIRRRRPRQAGRHQPVHRAPPGHGLRQFRRGSADAAMDDRGRRPPARAHRAPHRRRARMGL
jgi:phosphoserine phosphatase